jgi:hypothetical protein
MERRRAGEGRKEMSDKKLEARMKYYCKTCKTELIIGENVETTEYFHGVLFCPCDGFHGEMQKIHDYETPAQYRARTGKPFPDNGLVFYRHVFDGETGKWEAGEYLHTVVYCAEEGYDDIVIADPPVPPPEDWREEKDG